MPPAGGSFAQSDILATLLSKNEMSHRAKVTAVQAFEAASDPGLRVATQTPGTQDLAIRSRQTLGANPSTKDFDSIAQTLLSNAQSDTEEADIVRPGGTGSQDVDKPMFSRTLASTQYAWQYARHRH